MIGRNARAATIKGPAAGGSVLTPETLEWEGTMPHVIVKLWPGKSEQKKKELAERITEDVMRVLNYAEDSVSVAFEEIDPEDWAEQVYRPDIIDRAEKLYKRPGYRM